MPAHALDRRLVVQIGAVFEHQIAGSMLVHEQRQIALRRRRTQYRYMHIHETQAGHVQRVLGITLEEVHHLRERGVAGGARQPQRLENPVQRRVGVLHRFQHDAARPQQERDERGIVGDIRLQRQHIDKETDHRLQLQPRTARNAHRCNDAILAAIARQQRLECGEHQNRQRDLLLAGERLQTCIQRRRNLRRAHTALKTLHWRPSAIGRQIQHRRCVGKMLGPKIQLLLQAVAAEGLLLPERYIGDLQLGRGAMKRLARTRLVVSIDNLLVHRRNRPPVDRDVMEDDRQQMQVVRDLDQYRTDRRLGRQNERPGDLLARDAQRIPALGICIEAFRDREAPRQLAPRKNLLVGLPPSGQIDGPEYFVAVDQRLHRSAQRVDIKLTVQPLAHWRVVGDKAGRELVEQP